MIGYVCLIKFLLVSKNLIKKRRRRKKASNTNQMHFKILCIGIAYQKIKISGFWMSNSDALLTFLSD